MPVLFRDAHTRQPQYAAGPNPNGPIKNLVFAETAPAIDAAINRSTRGATPFGAAVYTATEYALLLRQAQVLQNADVVTFGGLLYAPAAPAGSTFTRIFGTRGEISGSASDRRGWEVGLDGGSTVEASFQVFNAAGGRYSAPAANLGSVGSSVVGKPLSFIAQVVRTPATNTVLTAYLKVGSTAEVTASTTVTTAFADNNANNFVGLCGKLSALTTLTDFWVLSSWATVGYVTAGQRAEVYQNPWSVFRPPARKLWLMGAASGSASLTANGGTLTLTGGSATLTKSSALTAQGGTLSLTGGNATLAKASSLTAQGGTLSLTGGNATLAKASVLTAQGGTLTLTGGDADLTHETAGAYTLTALGGTLSLTGGDAVLTYVSLNVPQHGGSGSRVRRSREFNEFIEGLFKKKTRKQTLQAVVAQAVNEEKLQQGIEFVAEAFRQKHVQRDSALRTELELVETQLRRKLQDLEDEEYAVVSLLL